MGTESRCVTLHIPQEGRETVHSALGSYFLCTNACPWLSSRPSVNCLNSDASAS